MTALREAIAQIGRDLIAKRLWPVALALLAAIAVVPMLIGGSSADPANPAAPVAAAPPATDPAALAAPGADGGADAPPTRSPQTAGGAVRDPFYDPPGASADAAATAGADAKNGAARAVAAPDSPGKTSGPPAAGNAKPRAGATPAAPKSTSTTPTPAPRPAPAPTRSVAVSGPSYYRTVVGWSSSRRAPSHAIARLTPLGGRRNPAALYLGVTKPGATYAIFVLGAHATSHGEGTCRAGTRCRMIALRPGETRRFAVRSPAGGSVQRFTLRLRSLKSVQATASAARRGRSREHADGRDVLYAMWRSPALAEVLAWARYDRSAGLLRPAADRADVEQPTR